MKQLLSILFLLVFSATISAQKSRIVGKVTNSKNEALASVTVKLSGAATAMTRTDVEGRFSFTAEAEKKYTLTVSYVGYQEKIIDDVSVSKAGEDETVNIILNESSKVLSDVSVKATTRNATAKGETVNALITFQKNTNTVASVISAEAIKRSPDRNTGEVIKRTPGASIQEGKFLVIRGLAERYNLATLNGIQLGSTEPDRKAFSFDMIPAHMIDNIVIN